MPFASGIISEETVKSRFGRFSMRSDPLLLAQIAEGKQRYVQFRCPRPRGTACISERSLCARTGESSHTRPNWFHRFVERARIDVSLFASVPSNLLAFTCARALTPTRSRWGTIGSVVQRSSVAPQSGDKKIRRQKNYRRKDRPQIRSFRANNYRINYSAGSARSPRPRYSCTRAHAWSAAATRTTATVRH